MPFVRPWLGASGDEAVFPSGLIFLWAAVGASAMSAQSFCHACRSASGSLASAGPPLRSSTESDVLSASLSHFFLADGIGNCFSLVLAADARDTIVRQGRV